jgi:hypothetical protein
MTGSSSPATPIFGTFRSRHDRTRASFVLLHQGNELTPDAQADLLLTALAAATAELESAWVWRVLVGLGSHAASG